MERDLERNKFRFYGRFPASQRVRAFFETARLLKRGFRYLNPTHPVGAAVAANVIERGRKRKRSDSPRISAFRNSASLSPPMRRARYSSRGRSMARRPARRVRRRGGRAVGALSRQHDQRTTYVARRGRGRGRRRRYGYRIQNALLRMEPLQTYTTKESVNATSNVNQNGMFGVGLFTTSMVDQPDLENISTDAGTSTSNTSRFWIKSACLDVEFKNTGSNEIIMDVYTLLLRQDTDATANMYSQFQTYFNMQGTITGKDFVDVANTVFQNPEFCKYYKVLSKREIQLQSGSIAALQMRRGKDLYVPVSSITTNNTGIPGVTKFFFFMWHGPPDATAGTEGAAAVGATTVTFSYQKSYTYGLVPGARTTSQIHND